MSAPSVFFGCTPVSHVAPARAWSPGPSPRERPLICARLLSTSVRSRNGANAFMVELNSKAAPSPEGLQLDSMIPFGTYTKPKRTAGLAAFVVPANAGTIASRNGSASTAPAPRKNARRGSCFRVTIIGPISLFGPRSFLKRSAHRHCCNQIPHAIVFGGAFPQNRSHRRLIVVFQSTAKTVCKQLLRYGRGEFFTLRSGHRFSQARRPVEIGPVWKFTGGIDLGTSVFTAPLPNSILVLQRESDGIHHRMAAGATRIGAMLLQRRSQAQVQVPLGRREIGRASCRERRRRRA